MSLAVALTAEDILTLPGKRDEDWRWTDLRGLIRQPLPEATDADGVVQPGGPFKGLTPDEIVIANGRLNWWPEDDLSPGLKLAEDAAPDAPLMAAALPMAQLAARRSAREPTVILSFLGGDVNTATIRFVADASASAQHSRVGIVVKAGVAATLLESHEGHGEDHFTNTLLEIFLEEGASLERVVLADDVSSAVSVVTAEVHLESSARFAQTILTTGAKRQRIETRIAHPGHEASVRLDGAYLLEGQRHADLTTTVTHGGVDGTTAQLTKGVVRDQARGVFQGRIVVEPGADRTDARMRHQALILSERAEIDAKPELLIFADDVQCAHGNTIGALDEDAIFYARQRGMPADRARAMLTAAFVGEVIDRIEHEGARETALAWAERQLGSL